MQVAEQFGKPFPIGHGIGCIGCIVAGRFGGEFGVQCRRQAGNVVRRGVEPLEKPQGDR